MIFLFFLFSEPTTFQALSSENTVLRTIKPNPFHQTIILYLCQTLIRQRTIDYIYQMLPIRSKASKKAVSSSGPSIPSPALEEETEHQKSPTLNPPQLPPQTAVSRAPSTTAPSQVAATQTGTSSTNEPEESAYARVFQTVELLTMIPKQCSIETLLCDAPKVNKPWKTITDTNKNIQYWLFLQS